MSVYLKICSIHSQISLLMYLTRATIDFSYYVKSSDTAINCNIKHVKEFNLDSLTYRSPCDELYFFDVI